MTAGDIYCYNGMYYLLSYNEKGVKILSHLEFSRSRSYVGTTTHLFEERREVLSDGEYVFNIFHVLKGAINEGTT